MTPQGVDAIIAKSHTVPLQLIALAVVLGLAAGYFTEASLTTLSAIFAVIAIAFSAHTLRAVRRMRSYWSDFELALADSSLESRTPDGTRKLDRNEVSGIAETPGFGLSILATDQARSIYIPDGIERYGELKAALGSWAELKSLPAVRPTVKLFSNAAMLVLAFLYLAVLFGQKVSVVLPAGMLFVFVLGYIVLSRRGPIIPPAIALVVLAGRVLSMLS